VLCESLNYSQGVPEVVEGTRSRPYAVVYSPPFDEFEVTHIKIPEKARFLPAGIQENLPASPVRPLPAASFHSVTLTMKRFMVGRAMARISP
jgi:hypothetical protein